MAGFSAVLVFWKIALRNVWRSRRRSVATFITLFFCVVLSIVTLGLARGISRQMTQSVVKMRTGHLRAAVENASDPMFPMPFLPTKSEVAHVFAPRLFLLGMVVSRQNAMVRFSLPLPLGYELQRGRPPVVACEVVVDANGEAWVGAQLEVPLKDCPLLTVTGSLKFAMEFAGAPVWIFVSKEQLLELEQNASVESKSATATKQQEPNHNEDTFDVEDIDQLPQLDLSVPETNKKNWKLPRFQRVYPSLPETSRTYSIRVVRGAPVQLHAVDPLAEQHFAIARSVVFGTWLPAQTVLSQDRPFHDQKEWPVVVGAALARRLGVHVGDRIGLDIFDAQGVPRDVWCDVVGLVFTQDAQMDTSALLAPLTYVAPELGYVSADGFPLVHELSILLPHGVDLRVKRELQKMLPPSVVVRTWQEVLPGLRAAVTFQEGLVYMILAIVLLMAVIGTLNSFVMSILERTWELGVLKAVGVRARALIGMILLEALMLVSMAVVAGGVVGALVCRELEREGLDLTFLFQDGFTFAGVWLRPVWYAQLDTITVGVPALVLAVAGFLAALWPALRAARMPICDALARVE